MVRIQESRLSLWVFPARDCVWTQDAFHFDLFFLFLCFCALVLLEFTVNFCDSGSKSLFFRGGTKSGNITVICIAQLSGNGKSERPNQSVAMINVINYITAKVIIKFMTAMIKVIADKYFHKRSIKSRSKVNKRALIDWWHLTFIRRYVTSKKSSKFLQNKFL